MGPDRITWQVAEHRRLEFEKEQMQARAPSMAWIEASADLPSGGWEGEAPEWPIERPAPERLSELLGDRCLKLRVAYSEGFPMDPPRLIPLDPEPDFDQRLRHELHLNADGTLCLLPLQSDWTGEGSAADLVEKASAWFIEWRALEVGLIDKMSDDGMYVDESLDKKIEEYE